MYSTDMNELQRAYIAGIVDGEGSICMIKRTPKRMHSPEVHIWSTDKELIDYIQDVTETGFVIRQKAKKEHHKESYAWCLYDKKALTFLEEIFPYLRINRKRQRAWILINQYAKYTPANGKYTPEMLEKKKDLIKRFKAI